MRTLPRALALLAALALLGAPARADEADEVKQIKELEKQLAALKDKPKDKDNDKPKDKDKDKPAAKKPLTIAHVKLSGSLDEKPPLVDPLIGSIGETFREKLDRIKKAKNDANVHALLLEIDGLAVNWGKVNELTRAIQDFRKSGKKVFAYVESGSTRDYAVGLACDEVALPPVGMLLLTGARIEVTFFKPLLEKLGVKADMLQMGEYKGAAEPLTRDKLSDANRKQLTSILDDYFDNEVVGRIVASRGKKADLDIAKVKELIDDGPYSSREALKVKLVDRLVHFESYEKAIKGVLKADAVKLSRDYAKKKDDEDINVFALYRKLLFGPGKPASSKAAKVAVIYANGPIMTGKSSLSILGGETMGSDTMVKAIREAEADATVKAIVLRVNSPGGSALASDLIWAELKRCKKPVIASMADVAGSGGYYICMSAKKIFAEPGTLTGSIGVVSGKLATKGLWDKVGIKTDVIARGKNSGILTSDEPFTDSERKRMTKLMQDIYDEFVDKALEGRQKAGKKMTRKELLELAGGRIYTGRQAKANGIIDEVGTLQDAIAEAAKQGGLPADKEPELLQLPKPKSALDALFGSLPGAQAPAIRVDLIDKVPGLKEKLRGVDALLGLRKEAVWLIAPYRIEVE
jgi:protease-4